MDGKLLQSRCHLGPIYRVYLAGPVDTVDKTTSTSWRKLVADVLAGYGIITYLPNMPWYGLSDKDDIWPNHASWIDAVCRYAIMDCDAVFAYMHKVTIGTVREIEWAKLMEKPVFAVYPEEKKVVMTHDIYVYKTTCEALNDLIKLSPKGWADNAKIWKS